MRRHLESNAIGLLSNWDRLGSPEAIDPPSVAWLGNWSPSIKVRRSGLWNVNHVVQSYNAAFLDDLSRSVGSRV
jgi:hypothetical protein